MAVERICPACDKPVFSAAAESDWICPHCGGLIPREGREKALTNLEIIRILPVADLARFLPCPNEMGLGEQINDCSQSDDIDCYKCTFDWLNAKEAKCRICGCSWLHACKGGCYWVEPDLCSKCAKKEKDR